MLMEDSPARYAGCSLAVALLMGSRLVVCTVDALFEVAFLAVSLPFKMEGFRGHQQFLGELAAQFSLYIFVSLCDSFIFYNKFHQIKKQSEE